MPLKVRPQTIDQDDIVWTFPKVFVGDGTAPTMTNRRLYVRDSQLPGMGAIGFGTIFVIERAGIDTSMALITSLTGTSALHFGDPDDYNAGQIYYHHETDSMHFYASTLGPPTRVGVMQNSGFRVTTTQAAVDNPVMAPQLIPRAAIHACGGYDPSIGRGQIRLQSYACTGTSWDIFHNAAGADEYGLNFWYTRSGSGSSYVTFHPPYYSFGRNDHSYAHLLIYGHGAGNQGGRASWYLSAAHDGTFDYWGIDAYEDDFRVFQSTGEVRLTVTPTRFEVSSLTALGMIYSSNAANTILDIRNTTGATGSAYNELRFSQKDSNQANQNMGSIRMDALDVTAGSEDSEMEFRTIIAGSITLGMILNEGLRVGSPVGGDQGAGTINVDTDIYKDGVAYANPDYVFEHWLTGNIKLFADRPGAAEYQPMTIHQVRDYVSEHLHLPGMAGAGGIFVKGERMLEWVERMFIYQMEHEDRLMALEEKVHV